MRNGRNTHFLPNSFGWVQKQVWETGKKAPEWNFRVGKGGYWEQSRRRKDTDFQCTGARIVPMHSNEQIIANGNGTWSYSRRMVNWARPVPKFALVAMKEK